MGVNIEYSFYFCPTDMKLCILVKIDDTFAKNLKAVQPHVFAAAPRVWTKLQLGLLTKFPQKKLDTLLKIPLLSSLLKKLIKKVLGLVKLE